MDLAFWLLPLDCYEADMNLHFDCVFYYVRDLDSAIPFYSEVLGIPLISRDAVARLDVDGVLFEIGV